MNAGDVDVVARTVAFVIMTVAAEMKKVQFVDQTELFEKFERSVNGYAGDIGVDLLRDIEDFARVHVTRGRFHDLHHDTTLLGKSNAARSQFTLKMARRFADVDAFAC